MRERRRSINEKWNDQISNSTLEHIPTIYLPNYRRMAKTSKGVTIRIYSSNSFGRSRKTVMLETSLSKVAELQSGKH